MFKPNKMYLVKAEPAGADLARFQFPVVFRVQNGDVSYDVTYDKNGNRSVLIDTDTDTEYDEEINEILTAITRKLDKPVELGDQTFNRVVVIDAEGNTAFRPISELGGGTGGMVEEPLTTEFIVSKPAGNLNLGDTFPEGLTLAQAFETLLTGTLNPTFTNPSFTLTNNASGTREVGETLNLTLTANFNRGNILGNLVNGAWVPTSSQGPKAGAVIEYTIAGETQQTNSKQIQRVVTLGVNQFSGSVSFGVGIQPINSKNEPFGEPHAAGTLSANTSFTGAYKLFYGIGDEEVEQPRTLTNVFRQGNSQVLRLNTGNVKQHFHVFLLSDLDILSVVDTTALNTTITSEYEFKGEVEIADGGGNMVTYRHFQMSIDVNYDTNHEHVITLKSL